MQHLIKDSKNSAIDIQIYIQIKFSCNVKLPLKSILTNEQLTVFFFL